MRRDETLGFSEQDFDPKFWMLFPKFGIVLVHYAKAKFFV
jgi:hypothetical protein